MGGVKKTGAKPPTGYAPALEKEPLLKGVFRIDQFATRKIADYGAVARSYGPAKGSVKQLLPEKYRKNPKLFLKDFISDTEMVLYNILANFGSYESLLTKYKQELLKLLKEGRYFQGGERQPSEKLRSLGFTGESFYAFFKGLLESDDRKNYLIGAAQSAGFITKVYSEEEAELFLERCRSL